MARNSIVCTLYDGDYHWGVGALINSLHFRDFRGLVCVGYRSQLPPWALARGILDDHGTSRLDLGKFEVLFSPVITSRNLANYKPDFMLEMLAKNYVSLDYIFFFDADIFISADWSFFESWADAGVALVSDGNSPMHPSHPVRVAWRKSFEPLGFSFARRNDYYYNSGFLGLTKDRIWVLESWAKIQNAMAEKVDLNLPLTLPGAPEWQRKRSFPFYIPDQDALNIVADLEAAEISVIGPEGMGWKQPSVYMQHACGSPKPWRSRYVRDALQGRAPSHIDYYFWQNVSTPIAIADAATIRKKQRHIAIARRLARLGVAFNILRPV
jgi:hypothetical protein